MESQVTTAVRPGARVAPEVESRARDKAVNFTFVLPALLIFSIFYIYPFFYTFWLSLHEWDMIGSQTFVGLRHFQEIFLFDERGWWPSMYNALFITFFALTLQNILAFVLALGVDKAVRMGNFYRVVFFILPILAEIIIGLLMRDMFVNDPGVFNRLLGFIGLDSLQRDWLGNEHNALITAALVHGWKGFGWGFIIFLAGLQTIPQQLYEAARIDGANSFQCFQRITLPLMIPVIVMVVILTILGSMQAFAMILTLTRSVVTVPVMLIYNHIKSNLVGLASAEGVIIGIILVSVSLIMMQISKLVKTRFGV